jgi:DNA-binding MarR family transcriptional regulator
MQLLQRQQYRTLAVNMVLPPSIVCQNYRLIHDIYVLLDASDRRVLEPFSLTTAQFRILSLLDTQPEWRLTDLSDAMLCARSTITRLIDTLENSGWIQRTNDPIDRRVQQVRLTPSGVERIRSARIAHQKSLEARLGELNNPSQEELLSILESLRAHLYQFLENPP